ncbi:precorrin-6Y C5,15-methyltransferase (decarboxylating) subunit CbiT [Orenia metallireducens]|uniref:Precorrin-6Y C5,15-methyltransferase (Decarboxylating) subunit CbiT n=1 Tax=Orenia metallireducens TaxID=1413210 RepID=A0A1C0A794_9FIRM|nr:precorrin-6Y C5,15-methyltransferase (decarboxylating) subunit CbiT [Orenia metallireducens]OCL26129.1 precorrin-6Y C5,15-methyltransferase (decarboxylating) subunit CbiT [Orenia metallireducens]
MNNWNFRTAGIPDSEFIRGEIPMTKEEVRAVSLAKLRLKEDSIVYDIGAGTGSLTIETALLSSKGRVYSIERQAEGIQLIKSNTDKFKVSNVEIIKGSAPEALLDLPEVDRVFIGGSGGKLIDILDEIDKKLKTKGRVVINAITLNTLNASINKLKKLNYEFEICNIAVTRTRKVGDYQMLQGLNPVYIISGEKG